MTTILVQILLVFSIVAVVLLIANLIRSYKILTDMSEATDSIKKIIASVARLLTTWKQSAKSVGDFVGEVSSYVNIFKKIKNNGEDQGKGE